MPYPQLQLQALSGFIKAFSHRLQTEDDILRVEEIKSTLVYQFPGVISERFLNGWSNVTHGHIFIEHDDHIHRIANEIAVICLASFQLLLGALALGYLPPQLLMGFLQILGAFFH